MQIFLKARRPIIAIIHERTKRTLFSNPLPKSVHKNGDFFHRFVKECVSPTLGGMDRGSSLLPPTPFSPTFNIYLYPPFHSITFPPFQFFLSFLTSRSLLLPSPSSLLLSPPSIPPSQEKLTNELYL